MNAHRETSNSDLKFALNEYREQIVRCAQSLAVARNEAVAGFLSAGMPLQRVAMFTDGNLDKRLLKIRDQLEEFEDELDDLEEPIREYIRAVPLAAYDTGSSDTGHFLNWLRASRDLTPEQLDCIACQQARIDVEELAAANRIGHVRFQELLSRADDLAPELGENPELWIHLNPIRAWATFQTQALLDEDDEVPARAAFFPVDNDIRTAVMEPPAEALVGELERFGSCRLDDLAGEIRELDREDVIDLCRDLAALGLVAFG